MKPLIHIIILITLPLYSIAQNSNYSISNYFSSNKDSLILYVGFFNRITIKKDSELLNNVKIKPNNTLFDISQNHFGTDSFETIIITKRKGSNHFDITDQSGKNIIKQFKFTARIIPWGLVGITKRKDTAVSKDFLLSQKGLIAFIPDPDIQNIRLYVKGFTFETFYKNIKVKIPVSGYYFTPEILEIITQLPRNTIIRFTNITYAVANTGCSMGHIVSDLQYRIL